MENCSQCDREFNKKHLSPIISELAKNKSAFRKVFKSENPKFCRPCRLQWLELGKVRGDKVEEFIENMTFAKRIKTSESDDNFDTTLEVPGHSGMQKNVSDVTSALNDQVPGPSVICLKKYKQINSCKCPIREYIPPLKPPPSPRTKKTTIALMFARVSVFS